MTTASNRSPAAAVPDVRGLRIPERTLGLLRDLIAAQIGIHYDEARLDILRDRIVPLAIDRGFDSLLDYYYLLKYDAAASAEWPRVMDALSVQETYFWREADHFKAVANTIVPALIERQRRIIRIWSVPCASGEEPLSILSRGAHRDSRQRRQRGSARQGTQPALRAARLSPVIRRDAR